MIIFHGDDYLASRTALNRDLAKLEQLGRSISRFEAKSLALESIIQILDNTDLFGSKPALVIFGLFIGPASKEKKKLLSYLSDNQDKDLYLYEDKALTPTQLKSFPEAKINHFKPAPVIFNFLDQLTPNNSSKLINLYQKLITSGESPELIFALLVRQIRLLILVASGQAQKIPPWQKTKLQNQARLFSLDQLINFYSKLYHLDKNLKSGLNPLDLNSQLFNLLVGI